MKKFLLLAVFVLFAFTASAENAVPYQFTNAEIRETPAKIAVGYVTIENKTDKDDILVGAQASWAKNIELHMIKTNDLGVIQMQPVTQIPLLKGKTVELKQGGYHLMIFGVKDELKIDEKKEITLRFSKAGTITLPFTVQPIGTGSRAQNMMHDHMMMGDHKM